MANHNQLQRISTTPQANTIPYADETGFISSWLINDPVIAALRQQNEYIGSVTTAPSPDTQSILSQYVVDTTGRQPRAGDQVAIEDVSELWMYNGTSWVYFSSITLNDASTTNKGLMQVGTGLTAVNGIVSVDPTYVTLARTLITNTDTDPVISLQTNADYVFSNTLDSLTINSVPNSPYYISLTFTTGNSFSFTASNITEYFFSDNPPTFLANKTYKLVIIGGRCHIYYVGSTVYPINKITELCPAMTPSYNIATWTINNTLGTRNVFIRVFETATGNTVEVESTTSVSTITLRLYTEAASVSEGYYTAVIFG